MIYHRYQDEIFEKKKKRRISDITIQNLNNLNCNLLSSNKNKKKIIKLKNEKIEDYYIIKNFLPICEEFLLKNYKNNFLQVFSEEEIKRNIKTNNKEKDDDVCGNVEVGNHYSEDAPKTINEKNDVSINDSTNLKNKKKKEKVDTYNEVHEEGEITNNIKLEEGEKKKRKDNVIDKEKDTCDLSNKIFNKKKNSTKSMNLYENYVRITKKSLKEMDLPFDRAVLLNVIDRKDNSEKIIKIINKKKVLSAFGESWEEMIEYIISLKEHKNLMKIFDIYDDEKNFYIIMEKLYGKELFNFLVYKKQVKESICKYIISQILHAVNYLHFNNVIHRDIKPENLMFRNKKRKDRSYEYNYELVLIDYDTCHFINNNNYSNKNICENKYLYSTVNGIVANCVFSPTKNITSDCAKLYKPDKEDKNVKQFCVNEFNENKKENYTEIDDKINEKSHNMMNNNKTNIEMNEQLSEKVDEKINKQIDEIMCKKNSKTSINRKHIKLVGTYGYIAPEIIKGYGYSILSDMWSIGIIFYILMTGITPLPMCLMINYKNTKEILLKKEKKGINFNLLSFNNYPLAKDLCEKFLQFDPNKRMPNSDIASNHPWLKYFNILKKNFTNFSYENTNGNPYLCINQIIKYNCNEHTNNIKNKDLPSSSEIDNHMISPYNEYYLEYFKKYYDKDNTTFLNSYNDAPYNIQEKPNNSNTHNNKLINCALFNNNSVLFNQEYICKNNENIYKANLSENYLLYRNKCNEDNDFMNNYLYVSAKNRNIGISNGSLPYEDALNNSYNMVSLGEYLKKKKEVERKMEEVKEEEEKQKESYVHIDSISNLTETNNYNKFIELFESLIEKKKKKILSYNSKFNELMLYNNTLQNTDDILSRKEFLIQSGRTEESKKNSKKKKKSLNEENEMMEIYKAQNIETYKSCEIRKNEFFFKNECALNGIIYDNENKIYYANQEVYSHYTPLKSNNTNFYTKKDFLNNVHELYNDENNHDKNTPININESYENTSIYEMHSNFCNENNDNYLNINYNTEYGCNINNSLNNYVINNMYNNNKVIMGINYNSNKDTLNNLSTFSCINNEYNSMKFYSNSISNKNNLIYENLITNTESCDSYINQKNQNTYAHDNNNGAYVNTFNYYITNKFEKTLNPYINEYYNMNDTANSAFRSSNDFNEFEMGAKKKKRKKISVY